MPVNVYTGPSGSGKTYTIVKDVVVPAIAEGRTIVSNIRGLNQEKIHAYLSGKGYDAARLGKIISVTNDDLRKPDFFPTEKNPSTDIFVGGELVIIDEAQLFYGTKDKFLASHFEFYTMHRHFTHPETSRSTDMMLSTPHINYLNTKIRGNLDYTFVLENKKSFGLAQSFNMRVYRGGYPSAQCLEQQTLANKYDSAYFAFYKSGRDGAVVVGSADSSTNVLKSKKVKIYTIIVILLGAFALYSLSSVFSKKPDTKAPKKGAIPAVAPSAPVAAKVDESPWQVVGYYKAGGKLFVHIKRGNVTRTLMNPRGFYLDSLRAYGQLDGKLLTNYTGQQAESSSIGLLTKK